MHIAIGLVELAATVLVVAAFCHRFDLPSPLVLIVVGIVASYLSFIPDVELAPEVVLLGLLPPLLYAAALNTSLVDFNNNRRPILLLAVGLVAVTTCVVAVVVHWLLPDLPWFAAFAIGAVVAPPDAVAATSIGRRIGLPRRIVTLLEGESLLNDATALVALNTALLVGAAASASTSEAPRETVGVISVAADFLLAAGGGLVIGLAVFFVVARSRRRITDPLLDSGVSFVTPFAAYVIAEQVHASGVIAVVVAGLLLGHKAPVIQTAQSRISERVNWESIAFLLESAVFLLIGLQAYRIINDAFDTDLGGGRVVLVCAASLVTVIVVRIVWMFAVRPLLKVTDGEGGSRRPPARGLLLTGWAGMRGVVTLAAAFVIPPETPFRDVLLLIAFTVAAGTLFLQGLSLPWLARRLRLPGPDPAADALARANLLQQASQAGMSSLAELKESDPYGVKAQIKERIERRNFAAWEAVGAKEDETPAEVYSRVRREMIGAEREKVLEVRSSGRVPHEVVSEVLAMLDVEESMLDYSARQQTEARAVSVSALLEGACEHLQERHDPVSPDTPGECGDCLRDETAWVHLRMCVTCGHVGCCDSSVMRHASAHFRETGHPVMRSAEPGEDWRWCFVDRLTG